MKVANFSAKSYDEESLQAANAARGLEIVFFDVRLTRKTCGLATGLSGNELRPDRVRAE
jgi:hypothetical protein